ncbi:hypothetical protein AK812_SmicGene40514 [Symbiodinium microadriaticum]|uniref:Uncharacterized protein n=1 Tax=Symbiodinium microadriaticum TaxID=2951 RepID=A0A1Q9C8E8_SYMMI|nr:hypothetical protein AK812_SmicGene40514 [Symbiodinium microadriaticum]
MNLWQPRSHPGHELVQGSGCDLATVAAGGGLRLSIAALSGHGSVAEVQACGAALLGNLVCAGAEVLAQVINSGAVTLLVKALELHPTSPEVQECGLNALNNVAWLQLHFGVVGLSIFSFNGMTMAKRNSKHFTGSNFGNVIGPCSTMPIDDKDLWILDVAAKKVLYGPGGRTLAGGAAPDAPPKPHVEGGEPASWHLTHKHAWEELLHMFGIKLMLQAPSLDHLMAISCIKASVQMPLPGNQIHLLAASVLHLLGAQNHSVAEFATAGGVPGLCQLMEYFLSSRKVQEQCAVFLQSVGGETADSLATTLQGGALPRMLTAMCVHREPWELAKGDCWTPREAFLMEVQQIQANELAFAAILGDGSVVTWGDAYFGGDSSAVRDQLKNVQQIQANDRAFAAILGDGSVVTWGDSYRGGDSSAVRDQLKTVQHIQGTELAFAAILGDGSGVTWGDSRYGGDSSVVRDQLKNVQQIQATDRAFAAILDDDSVVTWGDVVAGGDSSLVQDQLKSVQQIQVTGHAFAAILGDGSVVTWGHGGFGVESSAVRVQLKAVQQIQATYWAFAAILGDGSVVTWGDAGSGGDSSAVQDQLKNVQQIQATGSAFAAILGDGSVVTWGDAGSGGDSSAVQDQLKNVQQIQAAWYAFAAILGDGSVVTWGHGGFGGDSSAVRYQLKNVHQIQSTMYAFAAILGDGSVVTWGEGESGEGAALTVEPAEQPEIDVACARWRYRKAAQLGSLSQQSMWQTQGPRSEHVIKMLPSHFLPRAWKATIVDYQATVQSAVRDQLSSRYEKQTHQYPNSSALQAAGCFLAWRWSLAGPEAARKVAEAGAVQLIVSAMQVHPHQVDVQDFGASALQHLADRVEESREVIVHFGGSEGLKERPLKGRASCAAKTRRGGPDTGELHSGASQHGSLHKELQARIVDYGLPKEPSRISSSSKGTFIPEPGTRGKEVERWTLWERPNPPEELLPGPPPAYLNLPCEEAPPPPPLPPAPPPAQEEEEEEEEEAVPPPPPVAEDAMRGLKLPTATSCLLASIAADGEEFQALVVEEGGIEAAVASMRLHPNEGDVQVECMVLLQNLLGSPLPSGPSSSVHVATAAGISELLVEALRTFPQHRLVQLTAVRLLRTLVLGGTLLAGEKSFRKNFEVGDTDEETAGFWQRLIDEAIRTAASTVQMRPLFDQVNAKLQNDKLLDDQAEESWLVESLSKLKSGMRAADLENLLREALELMLNKVEVITGEANAAGTSTVVVHREVLV